MGALRTALAALCVLLLSLTGALALDPAVLGQSDAALQQFRSGLDGLNAALQKPALTEKEMVDLRSAFEAIRTGVSDRSAALAAPLAEVNQQIASLGAPPEGGMEEAGAAKAREDLNAARDRLQSLKSQFDVMAVEAEQGSNRVSALQREQFFERIFDRNRSILNPALWLDAVTGLGVMATSLRLMFRNWWIDVAQAGNPAGLLLVPLFLLSFLGLYHGLGSRIRRWLARYQGRGRTLDDMARLWRIVRGVLGTAAALALLVIPVELALDASGYLTPRIRIVWGALVYTIVVTLFYAVLARRAASPAEPEWRVLDLDDAAASRFAGLAALTSFLAAFNTQLGWVADRLYLGVNYTAGQTALAALMLLALMAALLLTLRTQPGLSNPSGRKLYFGWAGRLVPLLWLLVTVGFGALLLGYLALANYIAHQMVRTAMVAGLVFIAYHMFDAAVTASFDPQSGFGMFLRRVTGLGERGIETLGLLVRTALDLVLLLAGIPLLILLWTLTWVDFNGLFNSLAQGVQVGGIRISPGMLVAAAAIFAMGAVLTKLFNRWLDRRILTETRIDRGVQDSILKGSTYAGYLVAGTVALVAAGLDFSNLALIAGALGIGIGLGLQSIVNNFVSGLIILAERPIRVGDWVSLAAGEGIVRRINVRSTEIETFDYCAVIVPNSLLVTEPVRNWTHNDTMGRFLVSVTLEQGCDVEQARRLLLEAARAHPKVLTSPEPVVLLARIAPGGLDFELRAFVADVFLAVPVASDIRFALLASFREKGITLAPPVALMQAARQ